jgi:antitoxin HicB
MQKLKSRDKLKIVKDNVEYEFEIAEEGGYVVSVPELPGCVSEGDTFEEAWEMIQDAMDGWLHVAAKHGDPIPPQFQTLLRENG